MAVGKERVAEALRTTANLVKESYTIEDAIDEASLVVGVDRADKGRLKQQVRAQILTSIHPFQSILTYGKHQSKESVIKMLNKTADAIVIDDTGKGSPITLGRKKPCPEKKKKKIDSHQRSVNAWIMWDKKRKMEGK